MALGYRTTFYFREGVKGWSESWHLLNATSLSDAEAYIRTMYTKTLAIRGHGVLLTGIRVSNHDQPTPRESKLVDIVGQGAGHIEVPADDWNGYAPASTTTHSSDYVTSALLVQGKTGSGKKKFVWLAGIPDAVIRTNPIGPSIVGANTIWKGKYDEWRTEFQGGRWGFRTRVPAIGQFGKQAAIGTQLEIPGPGRVGIIVNNGGPVYLVNQRVQLSGWKLTAGAGVKMNGLYTVGLVQAGSQPGTTVYYLDNSIQLPITLIETRGTIQQIDFEALATVSLELIRQSSHKRGRPFGLLVGRRSIRT